MRALLPFAFLNNGNELHDAGCYIRGIAASVLAEVVRPQHDDDHVQGHMRRKRCGKVRGSVHARAGNNAGAERSGLSILVVRPLSPSTTTS